MNDLQAIIFQRTGVVVAPVTRPTTPRTEGEQLAIDWNRHNGVHSSYRQSIRQFRRTHGLTRGVGK